MAFANREPRPRNRRRVIVAGADARELRALLVGGREHSGLSVERAADRVGISVSSLRRWERGDAVPSDAVLKALADLYGVPPGPLLLAVHHIRDVIHRRRFEEVTSQDTLRRSFGAVPGLSTVRRTHGLTQVALAELLSVSRSKVAAWENGRTAPSHDEVQSLAQALDMALPTLESRLRTPPADERLKLPDAGLRALRLRQAEGVAAVAERVGIDATQLTKYERGDAVPPVQVMRRLSAVLDVSVADVAEACGQPDPTPSPPADWTAETVGPELGKCRRWYGLTKRDVAQICSVAPARVQQWEAGSALPEFKAVVRLSSRLGFDILSAAEASGRLSAITPPSTWSAGTFLDLWPKLRELSGLSVAEVAHAIGVTPQNVSYWEHRDAEPKDEHLPSLAALLRRQLHWHPDLSEVDATDLARTRRATTRSGRRTARDPLGEAIRTCREAAGISRRAVAQALNISPSTIENWERHGVPDQSLPKAAEIAVLLDNPGDVMSALAERVFPASPSVPDD